MDKIDYRMIVYLSLIILILSGIGNADPIVAGKGETIGKNRYEIKASLFHTNYTKRHNNEGSGTDFSGGESRVEYFLPLSIVFGISDTDELLVVAPLYSISHNEFLDIDGNRKNAKSDVFGDIFILGKSMFIKHPDGSMSLGLGLNIPTGKSVFDLTSKKLITGNGSWDLFIGLFSQEKRGPFILYGDISYAIRFDFSANKIMGTNVNNMKIKPGNVLGWDIGVEIPMGSILSLLLEVNGKLSFAGSASYVDSGQDITDDIKKRSSPEITLERTNRIKLLSGLQFNIVDTILITPGVWIPLLTIDNYSGITYLVSLSLKF